MTDGRGAASAAPATADLIADDTAWDRFVAGGSPPTHLQTSAWARVKRANGWRSWRVAIAHDGRTIGAQVLVYRAAGIPWGLGYVGRGPVADGPVDAAGFAAFLAALGGRARAARIGTLRLEPELPEGHPFEAELRRLGWRPTVHGQPDRSRIVDLTVGEAAVLAGMHRKCRQSVAKAARLGVRVVEAGAERLPVFATVHDGAMRRAGIHARAASTWEALWRELAPSGMVRLFVAEDDATGEVLAVLMLVRCGGRVVDLYGGTTPEGERRRANYLLKWEGMRASIAAGATEYDLWGLPRDGIEQFKSGFGGQEVDYTGAWELAVDPLGHRVLRAGERLRAAIRSRRRAPVAAAEPGATTADADAGAGDDTDGAAPTGRAAPTNG